MIEVLLRLVRRLRIEELVAAVFFLSLAMVWSLTAPELEIRLWLTCRALLVLLAVIALRLVYALARSRPRSKAELASVFEVALIFGREWLPFLLLVSAYENVLGLAGAICPNVHDSAFLAVDEALLGTHPSVRLERLASPALTEGFAACYLSLYAYPAISAAMLYALKRRRELRDFMAVFSVVGYVGYASYLAVPVIGPGFAAQSAYSVALSVRGATPIYDFVQSLAFNPAISLEPARNCFPSLHTAWGLVLLVLTFRQLRPLFFVYVAPISLMIISTLYLRYHYVVDIVAGTVLAVAAARAVPRFVRSWAMAWVPRSWHAQRRQRWAQSNASPFASFSVSGSPLWLFSITRRTPSRFDQPRGTSRLRVHRVLPRPSGRARKLLARSGLVALTTVTRESARP